jgi:hypothetical protein
MSNVVSDVVPAGEPVPVTQTYEPTKEELKEAKSQSRRTQELQPC